MPSLISSFFHRCRHLTGTVARQNIMFKKKSKTGKTGRDKRILKEVGVRRSTGRNTGSEKDAHTKTEVRLPALNIVSLFSI